jgi:minor extracellular serine protease Vpr
MKKLITLSTLLVACFVTVAHAQDTGKQLPPSPPVTRSITEIDGLSSIKGVSPFTAFLLLDLDRKQKGAADITEAYLMERYGLRDRGGKLFANCFLMGSEQFAIGDLRQLGVIPGSRSGKVHTALVPVDKIREVAAYPALKYLEIGEKQYLSMDSAKSATGVNKVHRGLSPLNMAYTGMDVVVGVIDRGVDVTHPNFYDTTGMGNYRIKRFWKQYDNTGVPPSGYAYGSEFTTEGAILASRTDDSSNSGDGNHGTHTTGIAAGAGGFSGSPYKGVAYESDIVIVTGFFGGPEVGDAIKYIQDYAASVGKPCVINMSFGGQGGPHDGSSLGNQFEDSATGPGKLLVRAAGNDGLFPKYFHHDFTMNDTLAKTFMAFLYAPSQSKSNGAGVVYAYGQPNQNFSIRFLLFNSATEQYEDVFPAKIPATITFSGSYTLIGSNNVAVDIQFESGIDPLSNKPSIAFLVNNSGQPDGVRKVLVEVTGYNTSVQMWGQLNFSSAYFTNNGFFYQVYGGSTDHTAGNEVCGHSGAIAVGSYTSKNSWMPLNNIPQELTGGFNMAPIGAIAPNSSVGPTGDGRTKPDITAPGNIVASSVNSFSPSYDAFDNNTVHAITQNNKNWYFAMMSGTSMASPMVTGILALWLQQNPNLTREQAIAKMKATAITDNFTGAIPSNGSNTWGWGKINAFAGLVTVSVENVPNDFGMKIYPNPATTELNVAFDSKVGMSRFVIYDITGKVVFGRDMNNVNAGHIETINTGVLAAGNYILKVSNDDRTASYKIVKE